jgi:peroxiredoxin
MRHFSVGDTAPDFSLPDHHGTLLQLSDLVRRQSTLLVFNLGFV